MPLTVDRETILKFDTPGPRYTSYPTAPVWTDEVNGGLYANKLAIFGATDKTISLYIHIPFCESLCTYCGCNVVIRRKDSRFGDEYLDYLEREMELVYRFLGTRKKVCQLHWGGGTPTFLNEPQIERLYQMTRRYFDIDPNGEVALEIDPRTIDKSKIQKLRMLGFNRVSLGVQDFNEDVQRQVNRYQPYAMVEESMDWCRQLVFTSVNFDLIYGLPYQTLASFRQTIEKVIILHPDRIALYSFAYVPWHKRHQYKIDIELLPSNDVKLDIFLQARDQLLQAGYRAIAMDHFALAEDELARASEAGTLHRNFMGYTVKPVDECLGLGVSAIGFLENTYIQNQKALPHYCKALAQGRLPVERGKILSRDDQIRRWTINALMCRFAVDKVVFTQKFHVPFEAYFAKEQGHLRWCVDNELIDQNDTHIEVLELGKIFIRNVCMGFDLYLRQKNISVQFSRTV